MQEPRLQGHQQSATRFHSLAVSRWASARCSPGAAAPRPPDAGAAAGAGPAADGRGGGGGGFASRACTSRWVTTFGGPSVTIVAVSLSPACKSENVTGRPVLQTLMPRLCPAPGG